MSSDLERALAELSTGDHVLARGSDTRGHGVTRSGYLLVAPEPRTIQHNGTPTAGWRVCVGPRDASSADRSTWVALVPGHSIAATPEPDMSRWRKTAFSLTGARTNRFGLRIVFGGRAYRGSAEPIEETPVEVVYAGGGTYELVQQLGGPVHFSCSSRTEIWWAPVPEADRGEGW
ncbi:hypothetical protein [Streptomyces venezuelae]|uniref:hypothetical protein n=1 Tax=Streptomyces venezuelae TaxID=54571 RepID=UPI00342B7809